MQFWLRTKTGPVAASQDRIEQLYHAGKITDDMRVVSVDGGQTWLTCRETVNVPTRATTGQKKCTKCKRPISKAAKHCPHCNMRQPAMSPWIGLLAVGAVALLIGVYVSIKSASSTGNRTRRTYSSANGQRRTSGPQGGQREKPQEWYQGGTLHQATVNQWRRATSRDKLATAADWLTATIWRGHLNSHDDLDRLKGKARMLVIAADAAVADVDLGHNDIADVVAVLLVTMGDDLAP